MLETEQGRSENHLVCREAGQTEFYEEASSTPDSEEMLSWIAWYCSLEGHEFFCEVAEKFIEDDFNLTGLSSLFPFYSEALEMMLDIEPESEGSDKDPGTVESSAERLYGLIHQRFILTRQGMNLMAEKYERAEFGLCPRYYCNGMPVLPIGRSDKLGVDMVKLYCPSCRDIYTPSDPKYLRVDGACFGSTFAHLFLHLMYPDANRQQTNNTIYQPSIFGFKVNERSMSGPRMSWLRSSPSPSPSQQQPVNPNEETKNT